MINIDGHTFNEALMSNGWVIDAGCRGFEFAELCRVTGRYCYSLDIDSFDNPNQYNYIQAALMPTEGMVEAHFFGNGTGNFVKGMNEQPYNGEDRPCETKSVVAVTLKDIYKITGDNIDLLKLDIEGSEYEILATLEPIPKQVTVEFHEHCMPDLHNKWIERVMSHMSRHYTLTQYPCPHWDRYKYMDCLFIRKDLL